MENQSELLAGHAPANIVGGKRVSNGYVAPATDVAMTPKEKREYEKTHISETADKEGTIVNARPITIQDAFPTEAVKHFHEKPAPTHEKGSAKHGHQGQLFQPQQKSFQ